MRRTILLLLCIAVSVVSSAQSAQPVSPNGKRVDRSNSIGKEGTLIVNVTWGDIDNTPANDVYIEAHGFVPKYREERSFILKMTHPGQYEGSLPPAVYDVFVSEGTSIPRCRRTLIKSGLSSYWTLKLEIDEVYTEK